MTADRGLAKALQDRNLLETFLRTAGRLSSVASFRYDQLKRNPSTGDLFFDLVVSKNTHGVYGETVVGRRAYAPWPFDPELFLMFQEDAALRDIDLVGWIERGDPACLKWVPVVAGESARAVSAEDSAPLSARSDPAADPFGEIAIGSRVCPVWTTLDQATYLRRGGVDTRIRQLMRGRVGLERGAAHTARRYAVDNTEDVAVSARKELEQVHHMSNAMREQYHVGAGRSIGSVFPRSRAVDAILDLARAMTESAQAPGTPGAALTLVSHLPGPPVVRPGGSSRPPITSRPAPADSQPKTAPKQRRKRTRQLNLDEFLARRAS